jgi:hypothetical protein
MNIGDLFRLEPLIPQIEAAIGTFAKVDSDPAVAKAIAFFQKIASDPEAPEAIATILKYANSADVRLAIATMRQVASALTAQAGQSDQPVRPPFGSGSPQDQ